MVDSVEVRAFILGNVSRLPRGLAKAAADRFSISRQAANRHMARLVEEGVLRAEGQTRNREYRLAILGAVDRTVPITADLEEDALWREHVRPLLESAPANVRDICHFGFTEMVNNAKDHSGSATVSIAAEVTAATVSLGVKDEGIGVFKKIKTALELEDERHAILIEAAEPMTGTRIVMQIANNSDHATKEVFDRYATDQDDYAFQRTRVVVSLGQTEGDELISRSQAKRIVARLDRFKEVELDFKGIDAIGPAFADEIFRVFAAAHPSVQLKFINASGEVQKMILRAEAARLG